MQVRIREPEEDGGWEITEYQLQMSPFPGLKTEAQSEVTAVDNSLV